MTDAYPDDHPRRMGVIDRRIAQAPIDHPDRRHGCPAHEALAKEVLEQAKTQARHGGMMKIILLIGAGMVALASYGLGVSRTLEPRLIKIESEMEHIPQLDMKITGVIEKSGETSTAVIILTEQLAFQSIALEKLSTSIDSLSDKVD